MSTELSQDELSAQFIDSSSTQGATQSTTHSLPPRGRRVVDYRPHPLLRSGHLQTIFGALVTGTLPPYVATPRVIPLADGESLVVHEEPGESLAADARLAILVHGLGGDHSSPYMRRIASRLSGQGVRVWRVDLRGCGAGVKLAYRPAHAGTSGDLAAIVSHAQSCYPHARLSLAAFSLGGNVLLKMLGELAEGTIEVDIDPQRIERAIAVAPPADLHGCCVNMERFSRKVYTRYYLKMLARQVKARAELWEPWRMIEPTAALRTIRQFDHWYTAPLSGFADTNEYYDRSSSKRWLSKVTVPTSLLLDEHDPIIPYRAFQDVSFSPQIQVLVSRCGGHLGYVARDPLGRPKRWMDEWVVKQIT